MTLIIDVLHIPATVHLIAWDGPARVYADGVLVCEFGQWRGTATYTRRDDDGSMVTVFAGTVDTAWQMFAAAYAAIVAAARVTQ